MNCRTCKHCRPIRGTILFECGSDDVAGLLLCHLCGGWFAADKWKLLETAKRIQCPDCRGINEIPRSDGNEIEDVNALPRWCPGFAAKVVEGQRRLF